MHQAIQKKLCVQRIKTLGLQSRAAEVFHVHAGLQHCVDKADHAFAMVRADSLHDRAQV